MNSFEHFSYHINKIKVIYPVETNYPFSNKFNLAQEKKRKHTSEQIRDEMLRFLYYDNCDKK